jgi:para-nitrobenzyl esterase
MKMRLLFLLSIILCARFSGAQLMNVETANGMVSGVYADGISSYKGIPFAAPPIGKLRWKAPQPAPKWKGVRTCEKFSASPMQSKPVPFRMWTEEFIAPPEPLSEDCLYLNVWTGAKSAGEKRPVLVWIYGGGFVSGSAACAIYDGEAMAQRGVVFVSINYRVGVFGFMAHPALSLESAQKTSGNYGILDQIAALKWVKKNIAAFGGDPSYVTIAGQSAGSFSVNALVASPLAKGLFHKAIAQSGSFVSNSPKRKLESAELAGQTVMKNAGAKTLAELRQKPAAEIQQVAGQLPYGSFSPVYEDYVLPADPLTYFKERKHNDVPLLIGWVTGDGSLRRPAETTAAVFKQEIQDQFGEKSSELLKSFPATNDDEAKASHLKLEMCMFAAFPSHQWALSNRSQTYMYQFNFVPTDKPGFPNYGAFHTSEVPFALHTLSKWNRPWQARDLKMEETVSAYWINFIKTGNPNGVGLPQWQSYDARNAAIMDLSEVVALRPALLLDEVTTLELVTAQ